ncbi:hypothetical protein HPP92_017894 [Vanilla planifolia]|uniref:Uncharacterized protein n=1 Tax=Vanilla planifolia TaxID=51239 RepID=A0A835UR02_VANPL|nr:hypothetical protein HPP92_017894 [Vanilla planifolia]
MQGLQWPGLFHILASRPRPILSIRITGLRPPLTCSNPPVTASPNLLPLGLPLNSPPIEGKIGDLSDLALLRPRSPDEATVVHWTQHCLYDVTGSDLAAARLLPVHSPCLLTVVERDLGHGGNFLARFVEALHYYSALFDALGDGGGEGSGGEDERWEVERGVGWRDSEHCGCRRA